MAKARAVKKPKRPRVVKVHPAKKAKAIHAKAVKVPKVKGTIIHGEHREQGKRF